MTVGRLQCNPPLHCLDQPCDNCEAEPHATVAPHVGCDLGQEAGAPLREDPALVEEEHQAACARIERAVAEFSAALEDDLNTANALAAQFDLVREMNIAADRGEVKADDAKAAYAALESFDRVFAVLSDDDAAKLAALGIGGASSSTACATPTTATSRRSPRCGRVSTGARCARSRKRFAAKLTMRPSTRC